ncbi:type I-C CRISPR-associated protein Cas8c/Csd1 [Desulfovibrio porci]|uniref:type I-C CRISPR-associated protein Cas8c/Csd1 n=1 Tax=Desulfovibrio porci TaxID=2605782 RepID=UPI002A802853|nr:type I-C CRISPR-associated protein Cas8c/Csd1 [Desulfovibrio porci]MDY3810956.1 type I-C CRISPR-associated protein Cas8c/Csd1 [Desulfovibrio porci]
MILSELAAFYQRMLQEPDTELPLPGYSRELIGFVLVLTPRGVLRRILPRLDDKGKARPLLVPAPRKQSGSGISPNLFWDNTGYLLGVDGKGKPERSAKTFAAFRQAHEELARDTGNARLQAVAAFLEAWRPEMFADLDVGPLILDKNGVFQIEEDQGFLHDQPDIRRIWEEQRRAGGEEPTGICLATGKTAPIARIHPPIRGVNGANPTGAALVSFNCDAFESYGKSQSFNAPVSGEAAEAYTTALNFLLRKDSGHCLRLGSTSLVFWTEQPGPAEKVFASCLLYEDGEALECGADTAEDRELLGRTRAVLRAARDGKKPADADLAALRAAETRFFLLGLKPNQARLGVTVWQISSFGQLLENLGRHYHDLALAPQYANDPPLPPLWMLLRELAPQGKTENIPAGLGDALSRAVLSGGRYPENLLAIVMQRIRADKNISYLRAALLKAFLLRNHPSQGAWTMELDESRKDLPYLLGRLFALLEKTQSDAVGAVGASIKDRYIGAASATPLLVFPQLLRLAQHHISKADYGKYNEDRIAGVMRDISAFPPHLSLPEQGDFFIGYYHQRVANYQKKEKE